MDHLEAESGNPMVFRGLFSAIPELSDIDLRIRWEDNTWYLDGYYAYVLRMVHGAWVYVLTGRSY